MRPQCGLRLIGNRGVSGIDGTVSTAVGAALPTRPAAEGSVCPARRPGAAPRPERAPAGPDRPPQLTIVVVNNDGGGIFSELEQAGHPDFDGFSAPPRRGMEQVPPPELPYTRVEWATDLPKALIGDGLRLVEFAQTRALQPACAALCRKQSPPRCGNPADRTGPGELSREPRRPGRTGPAPGVTHSSVLLARPPLSRRDTRGLPGPEPPRSSRVEKARRRPGKESACRTEKPCRARSWSGGRLGRHLHADWAIDAAAGRGARCAWCMRWGCRSSPSAGRTDPHRPFPGSLSSSKALRRSAAASEARTQLAGRHRVSRAEAHHALLKSAQDAELLVVDAGTAGSRRSSSLGSGVSPPRHLPGRGGAADQPEAAARPSRVVVGVDGSSMPLPRWVRAGQPERLRAELVAVYAWRAPDAPSARSPCYRPTWQSTGSSRSLGPAMAAHRG